MPKIIKDLKENIKNTAMEQFKSNGYDTVSMRGIAKALGIAVGTLYNYYPNKDVLFSDILMTSWLQTEQVIKESISTSEDPLRSFIEVLYDDIVSRKGLGRILLGSKRLSEVESFESVLTSLHTILTDILEDHFEASRAAHSIILIIGQLHQFYPDERERNIAFILQTF